MANYFDLGQLVATPAALRLMQESNVVALDLIRRHLTLEAGELSISDQQANQRALKDGSRIFSSFKIGDEKIWVITEAVGDDGKRASTCILLPDDY